MLRKASKASPERIEDANTAELDQARALIEVTQELEEEQPIKAAE
jgi:hypothetical protein